MCALLGTFFMKYGDRNWPSHRQRVPKCLNALDLMHSSRRKVGLATVRTGPHRNALDHEERATAAETACYFSALQSVATAGRANAATAGGPHSRGANEAAQLGGSEPGQPNIDCRGFQGLSVDQRRNRIRNPPMASPRPARQMPLSTRLPQCAERCCRTSAPGGQSLHGLLAPTRQSFRPRFWSLRLGTLRSIPALSSLTYSSVSIDIQALLP
jgi:hypothetical protein